MGKVFQRRRKHFKVKALREFPVSAVNVVATGNRRYVYHRASSRPLPDLPFEHPDFIAAVLAAETEFQNATAAASQKLTPIKPRLIKDQAPPVTPDAIAYSVEQIIAWVHRARAGDICYYHFGSLTIDAETDAVAKKRGYTKLLAEFGSILLRQRRADDGAAHYYAIRTDEPLAHLPRNVLTGTVTADEYTAVVAIMERQSSQSVARAIRDAVGTTDDIASQMRNAFIRRGWITNSRPPQLTELGMSVLI